MPLTRSRRRKSLGEDSEPTTHNKRLKLPNKDLGGKPEEGMVPLRRSDRLKYKGQSLRESSKPITTRERLKLLNKELGRKPKAFKCTFLQPKQLAEFALCDYNKKHGTDLVYVRHSDRKGMTFFGPGYNINFVQWHILWKHFNFEARRRNADPSDEPFLLFAEVYKAEGKFNFTTLSLVKPTDEAYGCQRCWSNISHPRHGFRAGFDASEATEPKILPKHAAAELSEFALQDYNEKHGTNLKFERALECISFTCAGLLMDFSEKNTSWVHMNFEARVGPKEEVLGLFAELYLGDGDKYVLATLSAAEPSDICCRVNWKKEINLERRCFLCPDEIRHPWRGFRFAFNYPPRLQRPKG